VIWRLIITAAVVMGFLWLLSLLTGCAGTTVNAKMTGEPDFKSPNPFIPRIEAGVGYTF